MITVDTMNNYLTAMYILVLRKEIAVTGMTPCTRILDEIYNVTVQFRWAASL